MLTLEFVAPAINYGRLAPFLIVIGAAALGVLVEAFVERGWRHEVQTGLALLALLSAGVVVALQWGSTGYGLADPDPVSGAAGSIMVDGPTQVFWLVLLGCGILGVLLFAERSAYGGRPAFTAAAATIPGSRAEAEATVAQMEHSEVFPLALFSLSGMMLFVAGDDLLVLFVALEILSLPLYVLAALARHRRLASQEAALKYFLLGAAASAIFLFGAALLFAYAGSFDLVDLSAAYINGTGESNSLILAGLGLVAVGLLFKIGAVPFHNWAPDVYQGAPTPVTGFMAVGTKVAAVAALLRIFYVGLGGALWTWRPLLIGVAILTMAVGAVVGIVQSDIKRLIAYSSIAHAGFVLVGVAAALVYVNVTVSADGYSLLVEAGDGLGSVGSIVVYLIAYGFATLGCFACVTLVQTQGREATELASWAGLGKVKPWFGAVLLVCLLSLAGIPLTAGFIGKFAVFAAAWRAGLWWLALIAVLLSVVAVYIYFRVVIVMFFRDPDPAVEIKAPGPATVVVLVVAVLGTLILGLIPGPLTDLLATATTFLIP
jgi:NADH-quinone oxidoreductase subunit N